MVFFAFIIFAPAPRAESEEFIWYELLLNSPPFRDLVHFVCLKLSV